MVSEAAQLHVYDTPLSEARVTLRPLSVDDRDAIRRWMSDLDVIRFTVLVPGPEYAPVTPYSPAAADRYLDALLRAPDRRSFAVCVDGHHVGNVGLKGLDLERRSAECFIELGEAWARGRGAGRAAMSRLLDYAFREVSLLEVRLGVFEFNHPAIRLYRRLGFHRTGRYGLHYAQGRYWEVLGMRMTRERWLGRRRR